MRKIAVVVICVISAILFFYCYKKDKKLYLRQAINVPGFLCALSVLDIILALLLPI